MQKKSVLNNKDNKEKKEEIENDYKTLDLILYCFAKGGRGWWRWVGVVVVVGGGDGEANVSNEHLSKAQSNSVPLFPH